MSYESRSTGSKQGVKGVTGESRGTTKEHTGHVASSEVERAEISLQENYLTIQIGNVCTQALVDTGAAISCMLQSFLQQLPS